MRYVANRSRPPLAYKAIAQHRPRKALESLVREQGLDTNTAWRENVREEPPHISTTRGTISSSGASKPGAMESTVPRSVPSWRGLRWGIAAVGTTRATG